MVTRWYDPVTARFLSEDSLLGQPRNPDSRHRYAYGEGDPVNTWDPDGRSALDRNPMWRVVRERYYGPGNRSGQVDVLLGAVFGGVGSVACLPFGGWPGAIVCGTVAGGVGSLLSGLLPTTIKYQAISTDVSRTSSPYLMLKWEYKKGSLRTKRLSAGRSLIYPVWNARGGRRQVYQFAGAERLRDCARKSLLDFEVASMFHTRTCNTDNWMSVQIGSKVRAKYGPRWSGDKFLR